jgi:hypothetical protein
LLFFVENLKKELLTKVINLVLNSFKTKENGLLLSEFVLSWIPLAPSVLMPSLKLMVLVFALL